MGVLSPGLGLQPPGPEQHLFLLNKSGHLSSQAWERQLSGPSRALVVGAPLCLKSLGTVMPSFSPGVSFPVSKQPTLLAETRLHPGVWGCGQPLGRVPGGSRPGMRTRTFFGGSELPVVHLQLFQVCYQAKDSTGILRLAALKIGDWGDRTK